MLGQDRTQTESGACSSAETLIDTIRAHGCYIYGTGFVARLFQMALAQQGAADCIRGYLVTNAQDAPQDGVLEVHGAADPQVPRSALVCIAVHEATAAEIQRTLEENGYANTLWVYPLLHDLIFGAPLYRSVSIPLGYILARQNPANNWIAVRALAVRAIDSNDDDARKTYIEAQSLHCGRATAEKRFEKLRSLLQAIDDEGYDATRPILVDTNLQVIDGLHRVAIAWARGMKALPCNIVKENDAFADAIGDRSKLTRDALAESGIEPRRFEAILEASARMAQPSSKAPEISMIMPAFNVADYLDQCLQSIVDQTFGDFEVLLIDDGSSDGTGERCEQWAHKDARVHCLRKPNSGVSPSRNLGIDLARGTYLAFVDPDDWLDERYLEKLHDAAEREGADFAECDIWRYNNRTKAKIHRSCGARMGVRYTLEEHMKYGPTASYKAISKRSLWIDNDVRFPECAFESPAIFALVVALAGERNAYVPEPLYYYRRFRENSLVETAYAKEPGVADNTLGVEAMEHLCEQFKKRGLYERFAHCMPGLAAYRLNDILSLQYYRRSEQDFEELVANQRAFLERAFPELPKGAYITWGGYNLNKIMQHLPMINDPSCRFNFSSIAAIAPVSAPPESASIHHANRYREMMLQRELHQVFWDVLEKQNPRFIFMDFIDERFDLLAWQGRYLTCSDAYDGAQTAGIEADSRIAFGTAEHERIWRASFAEFASRLQAKSPETQLVIVENYLSERVGTLSATREFDEIAGIREANAVLANLYAFARETCPQALFVPARDCPDYFTDAAYEYGAVPQHLNDIVNQRIAERIEKAVL